MEKDDGEAHASAGQDCPARESSFGATSEIIINGERVQVFHVSPEALATIGQVLTNGGEPSRISDCELQNGKSTDGKWKSSRKKLSGLLLLAAGTSLVSGLCYGLHCQTHANHKDSEARNFRCHTKVGRRRSLPDGPKVGNDNGGLTIEDGGGHPPSSDFGAARRPECEVRAEMCVNRQPNGCVPHGPSELADIRAMLAEIRAGVVGLAQGPPVDGEKNPAPPKTFHSIGNFDYLTGFEDVWFNRQHYDLRGRDKARICLQYLVQKKAFQVRSARHFLNEIDPHVRKQGDFIRLSEIKIKDYFREPSGQLAKLRQALIRSAGKNGKYYLNVGAG
jgi:hypothetical protein